MIRKLEIFSWAMFLIGLLFRLFHFPLASMMIVVSLSVAANVYFLGSYFLFTRKKEDGSREKLATVPLFNLLMIGLMLSVSTIGLLFKIQIWPSSESLLGTALISLGLILIFQYAMKSQLGIDIVQRTIPRILFVGILGLAAYLIPRDSLIDIYYSHKPEFAKVLKSYMDDPTNVEKAAAYEKAREEAYPASKN